MLDTPVIGLFGVGKTSAKILKTLKIETCRDLIFYYPRRFDDFSASMPIAELKAGISTTVSGTIQLMHNRRSKTRRTIITEALLADETGIVKVLWFNQPFIIKNLPVGTRLRISGKTNDNFFDLAFVGPSYEKIGSTGEGIHTGRLVPVYPLTSGITQKQFRLWVKLALDLCLSAIQDWLPTDILTHEKLFSLPQALNAIHFPEISEQWSDARRRLAFDELLILQIVQRLARRTLNETPAQPLVFHEGEIKQFLSTLSFQLTDSQKKVTWELVKDLSRATPMNRLLEGDVGSGKTLVSIIAAYNAVLSHVQIAYVAPTEILAKQIYETYTQFLGERCAIGLVTGKQAHDSHPPDGGTNHGLRTNADARKKILEKIKNGDISIIIGTHALFEDRVHFRNLGLAVIDEQHRFGVNQRKSLREKNSSGTMPHLLSMTATPIPRSLALTIYGDLDLSIIDALPTGRKKIITKVVPARYRTWTYEFIRKQVRNGRQVFIVCPKIDPSDTTGVKSVTEEYKRLSKEIFPDLRMSMLHGKLSPDKKSTIMEAMLYGKIDILVATSVIEVGIDITNATVILIEGAERFGLAQLHQFRGRVGRGKYQSYCFLLPTSQEKEDIARLRALVKSNNGFELAEEDLKERGQGDVLGERQSGLPQLRIASLSDHDLIARSRTWADALITSPEHQYLIEHISERDVHLE